MSPNQERTPGPRTSAGALQTGPDLNLHEDGIDAAEAAKLVLTSLEDDKAEDILSIDIRGKSSVADMLVIATGRSQRHVGALADHITRRLKEAGVRDVRVEGLPTCDWVLVDAGDLIVHIFRPEVRGFYNIEKIWLPEPNAARA
ncbi:MAG: ribosome silencing factor [Hyphomonadaceae bacterium]|nr:ribosome silencing factor [Hyphomonadaceae bacterium]